MGKMKDEQIRVLNLRQQILDSQDIESKVITIPQWGGAEILVSELTAEERDEVNRVSVGEDGKITPELLGMNFFVACIRDPKTKERIFTVEDIPSLKVRGTKVMERIQRLISKVNGLMENYREDYEKN